MTFRFQVDAEATWLVPNRQDCRKVMVRRVCGDVVKREVRYPGGWGRLQGFTRSGNSSWNSQLEIPEVCAAVSVETKVVWLVLLSVVFSWNTINYILNSHIRCCFDVMITQKKNRNMIWRKQPLCVDDMMIVRLIIRPWFTKSGPKNAWYIHSPKGLLGTPV